MMKNNRQAGRAGSRSTAWAASGLALGAALALGACSSTPAPRFHSLTPPPASGAAAADRVAPAGAIAWEVLPVSVPPGVDQPQWVVRSVDGSLVVLEQERWVGPLGEELRAAVTARLTQSLGAPAATAAPLWRVRIDIQRLESAPGREARIDATWAILGDGSAAPVAARCRGEFVQVPVSEGYPALSAALQKAVARMADAIVGGLKSAAAGQAGVCEG
jgi:uncharacterized protein